MAVDRSNESKSEERGGGGGGNAECASADRHRDAFGIGRGHETAIHSTPLRYGLTYLGALFRGSEFAFQRFGNVRAAPASACPPAGTVLVNVVSVTMKWMRLLRLRVGGM